MENIKQQLEEVIKKNLPEKKEPPHSDDEFIQIAKENGITITSENLSDIVKNMMLSMDNARFWEYRQGFNECLSQINTSLIADEVLKLLRINIEKIDVSGGGSGRRLKEQLLSNLSPNKENEVEEIPQFKGTSEALNKLTIFPNKENKNNE